MIQRQSQKNQRFKNFFNLNLFEASKQDIS